MEISRLTPHLKSPDCLHFPTKTEREISHISPVGLCSTHSADTGPETSRELSVQLPEKAPTTHATRPRQSRADPLCLLELQDRAHSFSIPGRCHPCTGKATEARRQEHPKVLCSLLCLSRNLNDGHPPPTFIVLKDTGATGWRKSSALSQSISRAITPHKTDQVLSCQISLTASACEGHVCASQGM